jgi:hypothetical protein
MASTDLQHMQMLGLHLLLWASAFEEHLRVTQLELANLVSLAAYVTANTMELQTGVTRGRALLLATAALPIDVPVPQHDEAPAEEWEICQVKLSLDARVEGGGEDQDAGQGECSLHVWIAVRHSPDASEHGANYEISQELFILGSEVMSLVGQHEHRVGKIKQAWASGKGWTSVSIPDAQFKGMHKFVAGGNYWVTVEDMIKLMQWYCSSKRVNGITLETSMTWYWTEDILRDAVGSAVKHPFPEEAQQIPAWVQSYSQSVPQPVAGRSGTGTNGRRSGKRNRNQNSISTDEDAT